MGLPPPVPDNSLELRAEKELVGVDQNNRKTHGEEK